ncbi:MAG TPA: pyridoxamine 5'-phosphate oxidase family protein [Myxococcaceae bacterium]|nr:pyridoxamine 5'-phosphate oxidase family protein [Myxococcaceae bacterium]
MERTEQEQTHRGGVPGSREELEKLLQDYDTAVLVTRGTDGHFHARPMALQKKRQATDELWFATWADTQKVDDLEHDDHCALAFHSSDRSPTYVSVSGRAELVRDKETIRRLWEPSWRPWFPKGPDEEDIALIRFTPEHAEYVHPETGRLKVAFSTVKGLVTQKRPEPAPKKELDLH